MTKSSLKSVAIAASMIAVAAIPFVAAVPSPFNCGPQGSSTAPNTHNYDLDTAGILTVVYDQCLANVIAGTDDEWAAGIDGAFYNSANDVVGVNDPSNDLVNGVNTDPYTSVNPANVGGVNNCVGAPFTAHHGVDEFINTADLVQGGNIRVFVTADNHDDPGEQAYNGILTANGGVWPAGVDDPRDPCGDNSIDATDLDQTSDPCGPPIAGTAPPCAVAGVNRWDSASALASCAPTCTLAAVAGLDGNVVTFIGISTGNLSVAVSGTSWTSLT